MAGCARFFRIAGADLAITYLNGKAEPYVRAVAETLPAALIMPCNVGVPGELETVFERIKREWGKLDFVLHSIAFAPAVDLHASLVDCSAEGFALAMDVSCHSFIRMAKMALPLMTDGGSLMTVSFYGAERAVDHYNLMGPVKAALESSVRYLAANLATHRVHVHAISAGVVKTRAASGLDHFDTLLDEARTRTPAQHLVTIEEIGRIATVLASDAGMTLTGSTIYADAGFHVVT
jgi:enoyl-[acyl-carrier protein] reductase I